MHLKTKQGATGSTSQELSAQQLEEAQSPSALDPANEEMSQDEPVVEEVESPIMRAQGLGTDVRWNHEKDIKDLPWSPDVRERPTVSVLETSMGSLASGARRSR